MSHSVTLIPGEGIGPAVMGAARRTIDAAGVAVDWDVQIAGAAAFERQGTALPAALVESVRARGVALKGPLDTATPHGYRSPSIALRAALDLHTTIRPCRVWTSGAGSASVDLVIVKMNHEDAYAGIEFAPGSEAGDRLRELISGGGGPSLGADAGFTIKPISLTQAHRVAEAAFEFAATHARHRVTAVHKASLMRESDGVFLTAARRVAEGYAEIDFDDALVDAVCEQLVTRPHEFDVLLMPRMYGDIVSGIGAALIGSVGLAPGVNIGPDCAVFEPAHGTAPRLADAEVANPSAAILSGAMLLRHLDEGEAAGRLEAAIATVLDEGASVTYDLRPGRTRGGAVTTSEFTAAVIEALGR